MKVRAKIGFAGNDFVFFDGETKKVSEALGKSLIEDGLAEEVPEPPKNESKKAPVKKK
jgi:hypothetical protein